MSMFFVKSIGASLVGAFVETKYGPELGLGTNAFGLSSAFGTVPLMLTGLSFWTVIHGFMVVGASRSKYMKLAKDAGEKDVEERYNLPNLYVQGHSKYAKAFNCIQRSHQHIFETFTTHIVTSLFAAVHYPLCAAVGTLFYSVGRITLSNGYANAEGDPAKRYASPLATLMWYGLLMNIFLSGLSCVALIAGKPIL